MTSKAVVETTFQPEPPYLRSFGYVTYLRTHFNVQNVMIYFIICLLQLSEDDQNTKVELLSLK